MTQHPIPVLSSHRLSFGGPPFTNVFDEQIHNEKLPRQTRDSAKKINFLPPFLALILGSTYFLIALCIILVLPILQLAIGIAYYNQCPVNFYIPIYLIVTGACGCAGVGLTIIIVVAFICCIKQDSIAGSCFNGCVIGIVLFIIFLMSFFLFAWFIAGNVWVFGAKDKVTYDNVQSPNYCHQTLYQFAFWIIIITYILMIVSCCASCCRACFQSVTTLKA
ncbi:unnamed protein product [Adineta steineri]|uniref:Uncharacterized protein n=1 Tax=Adineta steineri TaxID=433720 RepID=A0A818NP37_9BILA|nr:unnamed protein product [Adineta steineri]CAF3607898.1 unnamed protein product [Adineta steineri]